MTPPRAPTCPARVDRRPTQFATDYQAKFNVAPGVYSVEAYDLTTIMLLGIDSGVKDRAGLVNYVKNYDGDGLARHYKWDVDGRARLGPDLDLPGQVARTRRPGPVDPAVVPYSSPDPTLKESV